MGPQTNNCFSHVPTSMTVLRFRIYIYIYIYIYSTLQNIYVCLYIRIYTVYIWISDIIPTANPYPPPAPRHSNTEKWWLKIDPSSSSNLNLLAAPPDWLWDATNKQSAANGLRVQRWSGKRDLHPHATRSRKCLEKKTSLPIAAMTNVASGGIKAYYSPVKPGTSEITL